MPVHAITPDYRGEVRDAQARFGGNILVYIGWDEHLLFCSAKTFPLPSAMTFAELKANVLPQGFAQHPDFAHINWDTVQWQLNGRTLQAQDDQTLAELGFDHKSLLRFKTPGLNGWRGTGV
ncbi:phenol hydroxylase subunit P4 [Paralysiella testudinis]|uniref:Phenol hydroxylase n=1 Tax=Paralysiella testudinis TaxID=2809020 RepID=A0A892ZM02_9NEIS|nr:phenol hydroxylase subunit P4 [Paralysiella testudinis]QRQ82716.1 phenol hydroxylase [Paralysiella testudinis]